ncbi:hypothetical protein LNA02_08470 [Levilactobacillus namurensis]|uniref:hypothetical protein n=1 Tax=Levilactobacillus namurensis TaxID=380393 RepID=UPI000466A8C4|nr:hypothetical protein [Levilactobacillus namurensis]PTM22334.1 hypothetical protein DA798_07015 [Lactobacillus sp. PFC-70]MCW3777270.1 hypothetical protein [Levilactobacillus namurensis]MDT7018665.1 hypothetical protein [Levilactobacillus namurensis]WNN64358.1 hypothetical protein RIN67_06460 [Levilactobacillus namurensis]GEO74149.1 hypothetical protein LNA02_08470 [Levilactobacillus namurensis]
MTKDGLTLIILVVLAVCLLSLVLMKSLLWAIGFPAAFALLGIACYGVEAMITKNKQHQTNA